MRIEIRNLIVHLFMTLLLGGALLVWMQSERTKLQESHARNARLTNHVTTLEREIGYTGMIHAFKNAVLRHDEPQYIETARRKYKAALAAIEGIAMHSDGTGMALQTEVLQDTLARYADALAMIEEMVAERRTAEEIDRAVRIDDGPAEIALREILVGLHDQVTQSEAELDRKLGLFNIGFVLIVVILSVAATIVVYRNLGHALVERLAAQYDLDLERARGEADRLKADEMRHRLGNVIGIVSAFNQQALADCDTAREHADEIAQRLEALSVAHEALFGASGLKPRMGALIERLAAPYVPPAGVGALSLTGDGDEMTEEATTPVCLLLHELMTNAAKYGAFSRRGGHVEVSLQDGEGTSRKLVWTERGGPTVTAPRQAGFGTQLIKGVVEQQLRGRAHFDFAPTGLVVEIDLPGTVFVAA